MKITTIKTRIIVTIMVTSLLSLWVACFVYSLYDLSRYRSSKESELRQLVQLVSPLLIEELNQTSLQPGLWQKLISENKGVQSFVLYRSNFIVAGEYVTSGQVTRTRRRPEKGITISFSGDYCFYTTPLRDGQRDVGYIAIDYYLSDRLYGFRSILLVFACTFLFATVIAYLISSLLQAQFNNSIISLVNVAKSIYRDKNYKARAVKNSDDEFGLLTDTINEMLDEISRREEEMKNLNDHLESRVETRTAALQEINSRLLNEKLRADQASCVKSDFLANMSHEIRTPMNGIVAACDLAVDEELSPKVANYLKIIQASSHTLLAIINDILDYSKLEAGTLELKEAQFSIPELLSKLGRVFREQAMHNGIELIIDIDTETPDILVGDRTRFYQILSNLLDNGIKFTQKGTVTLHIVCLEKGDDNVVVECRIRDTGVGLSEDGLNAIFRSFHQIDNSSTKKFGGTGLGLAIIKRLILMMGGTIEVSSHLGKGSSFIVTLRFGREHTSSTQFHALADNSSPIPANAQLIHGKHVLLAEDNETNRGIAEAMLTGFGLTVDSVENGELALDALAQMEYDIVILDIQMPVLDGYQTMHRIRSQKKYTDLPIVALTAHALQGDEERCLQAGANAYLSKPMGQDSLLAVLCRLCGGGEVVEKKKTSIMVTDSPATMYDLKILDVDGACRKLGVDSAIYFKILRTFCHDYATFKEELLGVMADNDSDWLKKKIHSLKGSSSTIGAEKLAILAISVDALCKEGQRPDEQLIQDLLFELEQVQLNAMQFVDDSSGGDEHHDNRLHIVNDKDLTSHFQRLAKALDESLYDQINKEIKVIEENITGSSVVKLGKIIRMYAYDDALELLLEVGEELGIPFENNKNVE